MKKQFKIDGMSCGHCVMAIEKELEKLEIENKQVEIGLAKIEFNPDKVNKHEIINAIKEAGFSTAE